MNGWNGMALPGIAGYTGAVGPLSGPAYGFGGSPYMTPPGGTEVLTTPTAPQITPINSFMPSINQKSKGWFGIEGLGKNLQTLQAGVGMLSGVAGAWNALQQNKLAKQSFNHQRGLLDTNLANSIRSHNLALEDRLRSRQVVEGMSDADRQSYMDRYSARDERRG